METGEFGSEVSFTLTLFRAEGPRSFLWSDRRPVFSLSPRGRGLGRGGECTRIEKRTLCVVSATIDQAQDCLCRSVYRKLLSLPLTRPVLPNPAGTELARAKGLSLAGMASAYLFQSN